MFDYYDYDEVEEMGVSQDFDWEQFMYEYEDEE